MDSEAFDRQLQSLRQETLPELGGGQTRARHRRLFEVARQNLSVAKLAEAHWDAQSILHEAGRLATPGALYAVWASELPGQPLRLEPDLAGGFRLRGLKHFATGAPRVERALLTAMGPGPCLVELDVRACLQAGTLRYDGSGWSTPAFEDTGTGSVELVGARVAPAGVIGGPGFYLERPGFWNGACGPAACWAGGAAGLVEHALQSRRDDPHTRAHQGAMQSDVWALRSLLDAAADEIDADPSDRSAAHRRALMLRHQVEQLATDVLRRFARACGPHPLCMNASVSRRYLELDLFLRQSHAERDLEALGRLLKPAR